MGYKEEEYQITEYFNEYYTLPLAEYNFESMPWSKVDFENRLSYFHQTLVGL